MNYKIAGAETMLGHYLVAELGEPDSGGAQTLFVCGGTDEDADAQRLNIDALEQVLEEAAAAPPVNMVLASSWTVYSPDAGEGVDESRPTFAWSEAGRTHARAEMIAEKWCAEHEVTLTIVRPALMFGTGVGGSLLSLFNRVIRGHYVHIRGNEAKMSAVTALDAARAMVRLVGKPGIFNLSDGHAHTWLSLVEAMTANTGVEKRMVHLPEKWAAFIYKWFGALPIVAETLSPETLESFSMTLVLDNSRVREATGLEFHDTLEVIARRDKTYPYENS